MGEDQERLILLSFIFLSFISLFLFSFFCVFRVFCGFISSLCAAFEYGDSDAGAHGDDTGGKLRVDCQTAVEIANSEYTRIV